MDDEEQSGEESEEFEDDDSVEEPLPPVRRQVGVVDEDDTDTATRVMTLKKVYKTLKTKFKRTLLVALVLLKNCVKKKKINLQQTPHEYYAEFQYYLTVRELHARARKGVLHCDDVRDNIENMVCLYEYLIGVQSPKAAKLLAKRVIELLCKIDQLAQQLESHYNVGCTNWIGVGGLLDLNLPVDSTTVTQIVPEISWFTPDLLLGVGGFGSVFRASLSDGPITSVKLIARDRFKNSENAAAGKIVGSLINSSHLVRLFAWFSTVESYVTVMEYIDGVDVSKLVREMCGLPILATKAVTAQLCMALRYLHFKGFSHRDVKPANMMVTAGCMVKLIDFDTNKLCIGKFSMKRKFRSFYRRTAKEFADRNSPGTLCYMPPEVLKGTPYGRAQDWWAVGVTLYQLHTDRLPFKGQEKPDIRKHIMEGQHKWPKSPKSPEDLTDCVECFLKKNPRERLGSRKYHDISNHRFFAEIDWVSWEDGILCLDWLELDQIIDKKAAILAEVEREKGDTVLRLEQQTRSDDQVPLYTFASVSFRRVMTRINNGESLAGEDLNDALEVLQDVDQPYKFQSFMT